MEDNFSVEWESGEKTTCQEISRKQIGIYWEVTVRCSDGSTRKARSANVNQSKQLACMKCSEPLFLPSNDFDGGEQPSADSTTVLTYENSSDESAKVDSTASVWLTFCTTEGKTIYSGSSYDDAYNAGIQHTQSSAGVGHWFKVIKD
jgi:hypothetical protein